MNYPYAINSASLNDTQLFWSKGPATNINRIREILHMSIPTFLSYCFPQPFQFKSISNYTGEPMDTFITHLNSRFSQLKLPLFCSQIHSEELGKEIISITSEYQDNHCIFLDFDIVHMEDTTHKILTNFTTDTKLPMSATLNAYLLLTDNLRKQLNEQMKSAWAYSYDLSIDAYLGKIRTLKDHIEATEKHLMTLDKYENAPLVYAGDIININPNGSTPQYRKVDNVVCSRFGDITIHFEPEGDEFPFIELHQTQKYEVIHPDDLNKDTVIFR